MLAAPTDLEVAAVKIISYRFTIFTKNQFRFCVYLQGESPKEVQEFFLFSIQETV